MRAPFLFKTRCKIGFDNWHNVYHDVVGDSDGIDGTEDAAGALIGPDTLKLARAERLDARAFLAAHDSYTFFDRIGDLLRTGPTLTNASDIRAVLIGAAQRGRNNHAS